MSSSLKNIFRELNLKYSSDALTTTMWNEIKKSHNSNQRFYHNLDHLQSILNHLLPVKESIENWDASLYSIFYHDIIYSSTQNDNEHKSAILLNDRLSETTIDSETKNTCYETILATKSHSRNLKHDINLFTDADLSILGSKWETYSLYLKSIRKEYSIYPDEVYNKGRKQVLLHFLAMKSIFKTDYFFNALEPNARRNLKREFKLIA